MALIFASLELCLSQAGQKAAILADKPAQCSQTRRVQIEPGDIDLFAVDSEGRLSARVGAPQDSASYVRIPLMPISDSGAMPITVGA